MTDKLDMSLDDIIEQSKKHTTVRSSAGRRGGIRKPRGRGVAFGRRGRPPAAVGQSFREPVLDARGKWKKDATSRRRGGLNPRPSTFKTTTIPTPQPITPTSSQPLRPPASQKLFLSNLGYRVSQNDIIELFSQIGPLKNARVNYDKSGRSLGTGEVTFEVPAHASVAEKRFNGILIDSKPLMIEKPGSNLISQTSGGPTKLSSGITVMDPRDAPPPPSSSHMQDPDSQGIQQDVKTVHQTLKSAVVATLTPEQTFSGSRVRSSIMKSRMYSDRMDIS